MKAQRKHQRSINLLVSTVLLASLLLAACGGSGSSSGGPADATIDPELSAASEASATYEASGAGEADLCANEYYPVEAGASHSYLGSDDFAGDYNFGTTISEVHGDGFTLTTEFDGATVTQQWACSPEGLQALTYTGGAAAGVVVEGMQTEYETTNVSGISLPATIAAGDSWSQHMDVTGTQTLEGAGTTTLEGTVDYAFVAVGEESVETPAGSFSAMRVDVTTTLNFTMAGAAAGTLSFTSNGSSWYAAGIGWVKSVDNSTVAGVTSASTVDLTSYSLP